MSQTRHSLIPTWLRAIFKALLIQRQTGHRGVNEAMSFHSKPLATQPRLDEYVGTYRRPPMGTLEVRQEAGSLVATTGNAQAGTRMVFYGPDVAYATAGSYQGSPFEFVRAPDGKVGWIRVNGRIARKDGWRLQDQGLFGLAMKQFTKQFALCLDNGGTEASLIVGKVYRVMSAADERRAGQRQYARQNHESG